MSINDVSVLAFTISDEHGNDSPNGKRILKRVVKNQRSLLGDKAYDSKDIHNLLDANAVKAIIPPRKKCIHPCKGSSNKGKDCKTDKKEGRGSMEKRE